MKLVTFAPSDTQPRLGSLRPDGCIVDLTSTERHPLTSMLALIDAGEDGLEMAQEAEQHGASYDIAEVRLLAPLPEPRQMRDFLIFEQHLRQARANRGRITGAPPSDPEAINVPESWYERPVYYKCNRFSVTGPESDIIWPSCACILDYELELGTIIGRRGRDIPAEDALDYVFGYTVFNDVSARDVQLREMEAGLGPAKGKDFDTGNVIGPCIVTRDEIPDPHRLEMIARVNGEEVCRNSSATSQHCITDMIAWVSTDETIYPGEFLGSGTVGNGCGLENGRLLAPGDVVELEITGIGTLRNRVVGKEGAQSA